MSYARYMSKAKTKTKNGRWVNGFYCNKQETTYCFKEDYERFPVKTHHYISADSMTDWGLPNELRLYEVDESTLCRCTGLKDKNGNLIWENDLVDTCINGCMVRGRITQKVDGTWVMRYCSVDNVETLHYLYPDSDICTLIEVVGNIFDAESMEGK